MKNFVPTTNHYTFYIYFIDPCEKGYLMEVQFSTDAPHYEAAVAQALAYGQQTCRKAKEMADQDLFMRVCRA